MISIHYYRSISKLVLLTCCIITILSCSNDDDVPPDVNFNNISQEIKNLIYFSGNEKSPTVLINVQAGPSTQLAADMVEHIIANFNTADILTINPHQAQTLNPNILLGNEITLNEAINFNEDSVETLYEVIKYFKDEGRTVYVLGVSFGAFITQELIAKKGIDVADKFLIITGRLDINDVIWQGLAEGKNGYFINGVTPKVNTEPFDKVFNRNEARLFAGIAMHRYTEQFNTIESLSNLTYIYGKTDNAVGSCTAEEVAFLQSKNANIRWGDGGHDETFDDFLAQGFREAFGIE